MNNESFEIIIEMKWIFMVNNDYDWLTFLYLLGIGRSSNVYEYVENCHKFWLNTVDPVCLTYLFFGTLNSNVSFNYVSRRIRSKNGSNTCTLHSTDLTGKKRSCSFYYSKLSHNLSLLMCIVYAHLFCCHCSCIDTIVKYLAH